MRRHPSQAAAERLCSTPTTRSRDALPPWSELSASLRGFRPPVLTADEQTIYLEKATDTGGAGGDIYIARRSGATWSDPVKLTSVSDPADRDYPAWASDDNCVLHFTTVDGGKGRLKIAVRGR